MRIALVSLVLCTQLAAFAEETLLPLASDSRTSRVLFLLCSSNIESAIEAYQQQVAIDKRHDTQLLQQIGYTLLEAGFRSGDPETQLLSLFGAGISLNERVIGLLAEGVQSKIPQHQLVAMNFLAQLQNDQADQAILTAMLADHPLIRLEAAYILCQKKSSLAFAQTTALMNKLPKEIHAIFPQLYGLLGTPESIRMMRRFFASPDDKVRVMAILSSVRYGRDDLLPAIRSLALQNGPIQQEACAWAFRTFKDYSSLPRLEVLSRSVTPSVRLAAQHASYVLGKKEGVAEIIQRAEEGDLYAIRVLGDIPEGAMVLQKLLSDPRVVVRVNAAKSLLEQKNPRCLPGIAELLLQDARGILWTQVSSQGGNISVYKIQSLSDREEEQAAYLEISRQLREEVLEQTLALSEPLFLTLAEQIFEKQQNDLIPALVHSLEKIQSTAAIDLLKKMQQKIGAPLIRHYCTLGLYRLKEEGSYRAQLKNWIQQRQLEVVLLRPLVPWTSEQMLSDPYQITPKESSQFLIEALTAFIQLQDDEALDLLLCAIQKGHRQNRYALAGLLMRTAQ